MFGVEVRKSDNRVTEGRGYWNHIRHQDLNSDGLSIVTLKASEHK